MKSQWGIPFELERLQSNKLKNLVQHAYHNVDYYKRLFNQTGIKPGDIETLRDIEKIPITTRKELQVLPKREITARNVNLGRCVKMRTSGSTGLPFEIFLHPRETMFRWLFFLSMYFENGGKLTDRHLRMTSPQNFRNKKWFQHLGILPEKYLSIFEDIEEQLKVISEFKPNVIGSFTSALKNVAIAIKKRRLRDINPRILFTTAESSSKEDREFISSVFKTDVIDYYSCIELGIIAWECKKHNGYHINSENVIVEFIRDNRPAKPGEESEIVITGLNNDAMPLIRYKIGDMGILKEGRCPCGKNSSLMEKIMGKNNDPIILFHDKIIYPQLLINLITSIPGVLEFQIIQKEINKIDINIIKDNNFNGDALINRIKKECGNALGDLVRIEPSIVENISKEKTGKFKVIKNEIESEAIINKPRE